MGKNGENNKEKDDSLFEAIFGNRGFVLGLGGLGMIIESIVGPDRVMIRIAQFVGDYDEVEDSEDNKKILVANTIKSIVGEFGIEKLEKGLMDSFREHKNCGNENCKGRYFIEKFIDLAGMNVFSESFVSWWQSTRPTVFIISQNKFTVNGEITTPIDALIALMDRVDYFKDNVEVMSVMTGTINFDMSSIKPLLTEWSAPVMALEKIIGYGAACDDKECTGCMFVKKLVERLGLDNLPESTQTLYRKVFLPN